MNRLNTKPYKGTRDFYPEDFALREYIFSKWRQVCESFGYEQYDASVIEPLELYTSKTSEEIVREQTFSFADRGSREVTLRPEMTPTVSRMVAARRQELGYPLRLFSIPNCFRYERMQRGRTREFWQLNLDLFGVENIEAEVEILTACYKLVTVFGASEDMFEIRINSRKLMNQIIESAGPKKEAADVVRLIDGYDKMPKNEFEIKLKELVEKSEVVLDFLAGGTTNDEIETLLKRAEAMGIGNVRFVPTIARGFDYYTDIVFEVFDLDPENNRAMFGGGRYDGLVGMFGVEPVPTIGIAPGDVTMMNFLESHGLLPKLTTKNDIYLMIENQSDFESAQNYANKLRAEGKNVALDFSGRKIDKQFKAAKKLGFADEQIVKFKPGVTETKGYFLIKSEERDTTDLGNKIIDKYKADNRFNFDLAKMTISGKHPDNGKIAIDKESDFAVFIVKGQGVFTVNGDTLSLSEGDAVYIRSGSTFLVEGEVEYITVCNPPFSLDQYSEIDI